MSSDLESRIRNEIREQDEIDPISRLEEIKKELERQLAAEKLLKHILGEEEYKDFINKGEIKVKSKRYLNRTYFIKELGLIDVIENNILVEKLCINTIESNFPLQDQLVSKKLCLEEIEELILKVANHMIPHDFGLLERINESREQLDLDIFSDNKEEFLKRIKEPTKFNLDNLFSDNKEESLKKIREYSRFDLENLFSEK